jgi:prophage regulatory protein
MAKRTPSHVPADLPVTGYVRLSQLVRLIPFSPATIWRKVKAGQFPKPRKLSANVTAWKAEEVRAWIDAQGAPGKAA